MNITEEIKKKVKITEILEEYGVSFSNSGWKPVALCPLHQESKPSFNIYPGTDSFYCFGCNKGGDVINFVMEKEKISFKDALKILADKAGIELNYSANYELTELKWQIKRIFKSTARFYSFLLEAEKKASDLLKKRGVTDETIRRFQIGYAPGKNFLSSQLLKEGFKRNDIIRSGLVREQNSSSELSDYFSNRLIIPFIDNKNVVYFTGRSLSAAEEKKYLNLPTNEFVSKPIFNIDALKMDDTDKYITEGIFDCILGSQNGLSIVALGGSHIKEEHIKLFERKKKSIYLVFDNDESMAGQKAAGNLATQMLKYNINPKVITLPRRKNIGKVDLAEFLNSNRIEAFLELKEKAKHYLERKIQELSSIEYSERNSAIKEEVFPLIFNLDELDIEDWLEQIKHNLGMNSDKFKALRKDFNKAKKKHETSQRTVNVDAKKIYEMTDDEKKEALEYLKDSELIERLLDDFKAVGIVGEEENVLSLYLFSLTRKLKNPISAVLFGDSSTGKSHLLNKVCELLPVEDVLTFSSATARSFEYAKEEQLKNKFIVIQEIEGMAEVEPIIRIMQSEGKLARFFSRRKSDSEPHEAEYRVVECPASIITTTTHENVHPENSTRIFKLFLDQSPKQTKRIQDYLREMASGSGIAKEIEEERIVKLHKNIQRLIKPIKVIIPYSEMIDFPSENTRNRRDFERFHNLIRAVALLRQYQKEKKQISGIECIYADIEDYKTAYKLGIKLLTSTLAPISDRAKELFKAILMLDSDEFTRAELKTKAKQLKIQVTTNNTTFGNQLGDLVSVEAIRVIQGGQGKAYKYKRIMSDMKEIESLTNCILTNPKELEERINQEESKIE